MNERTVKVIIGLVAAAINGALLYAGANGLLTAEAAAGAIAIVTFLAGYVTPKSLPTG